MTQQFLFNQLMERLYTLRSIINRADSSTSLSIGENPTVVRVALTQDGEVVFQRVINNPDGYARLEAVVTTITGLLNIKD